MSAEQAVPVPPAQTDSPAGAAACRGSVSQAGGSTFQNGGDRGNTWEVTAKMAMTGETLRKPPPKWRRPGKYFGSHRQNGDDRGNTSEVTAKMATTGETLRKSLPKRR